jgi:CitB family two-component system response regulator MalR
MVDVLIVEDDPMVAELNKVYLNRTAGFRSAGTAASGSDALMFLRDNEVELVLLDIFMPGLDGLGLLRRMHRNHPKIDVIMVTAARNSEDISRALRMGVIDYIMKPFTFERFQAALLSYTARVRLLNSARELNQDMLDKRIFTREMQDSAPPKGIDAETLERVRNAVRTHGRDFSVKDIVPSTGLSRISLKKYLDYLLDRHELAGNLVYPAVGRPVRVYRTPK